MKATLVCLLLALCSIALSGCGSQTVWGFYNSCSGSGSFVAMIECGSAKRDAYCRDNAYGCGESGNTVEQFGNALAQQVRARELSDPDALRQFTEFKARMMADEEHNAAIVMAGQASRPRCNANGCF
jgi:hypothetical protein